MRTDSERGAVAVEYGVILATIVTLVLTPVMMLGGNLSTMFDQAASVLSPTGAEASTWRLDPSLCAADGTYLGGFDGWQWTRVDVYTDSDIRTNGGGSTFVPATGTYFDPAWNPQPATRRHDYVWTYWQVQPDNPNRYLFRPALDDTSQVIFTSPCPQPE